jgi:hypothetical protein
LHVHGQEENIRSRNLPFPARIWGVILINPRSAADAFNSLIPKAFIAVIRMIVEAFRETRLPGLGVSASGRMLSIHAF